MFGYESRRNQPIRIEPKRSDERPMSSACGDAGRDGYSALSTADRETGIRTPVGGTPVYPAPRTWIDN